MGQSNAKGRALLKAAAEGDVDRVRTLISDDGADLDFADPDDGNTGLHLAALNNRHQCVECLAHAGANTVATNRAGLTPLHVAALEGSAAAATALREYGVCGTVGDPSGNTALHLACANGQAEVVRAIVMVADLSITNDAGETARDVGERTGHADCVALVKAQASLNGKLLLLLLLVVVVVVFVVAVVEAEVGLFQPARISESDFGGS